jgi:hypothetical protein
MPLTSFNSRITAPVTPTNGFIPGDIVSISFSGFSASEIDVTQLTSTGKKYAMGRKDCGTCTIVTNVDPATAAKPRVPGTAEPIYEYTMYLGSVASPAATSGIKFVFDAFLQNTTFDIATDDVVKATYTLQITGDLKTGSLVYSAT